MSYAQRKEISGNRTVAIIIVALVHLVLGYAIVTGLAYNFVKKAAEDLKTFDVEEPPPPPEEPPPPPEDMPDVPPPPMQPPPMVRIEQPPPPIRVEERMEMPPPRPPSPVVPVGPPTPPRPPAPPPPPPPPAKVTKATSSQGNLQGLISGDDYPQDALQRDEQGSVTVRLDIGTNGRVTGCTVTNGSGSRSLDRATCRLLQSRARFTPAKLSNGQPTTDTFTQTIRWQLQ